MPFLNRTLEVALLRDRVASASAELLVVYGRRRVGKTELLSQVADAERALYFEATDSVAADQLLDLTTELARVSGDTVLAAQPLSSWDAALAAITQFVGDTHTVVVLDEFQYLAEQSPELETTLSRWWRTTGRHLPVTLILAGSELSFFEDEVLAGRLYGRRTGQLKLKPFHAHDAALFHPRYSPEDRIRAFSICGGIPYYLERFTDDRPLHDHILAEVIEPTGLLHAEAELMLRQSLADPTNHIAVLRSIASGHNRNSEISSRTQLQPGHVTKLLDSLESLGLAERLRPVTAPQAAKKTGYAISDQFLRFHYRFIEPARSQLRSRTLATTYLNDVIVPQLDHHASRSWEDISREYVTEHVHEVTAAGRWWGQVPTGQGRRTEEREIDVVGVDGKRNPLVVGMCKWTTSKVDFDELNLLDRLAHHVPGYSDQVHRYLFSRAGFTKRLVEHAADEPHLNLVTPADIYHL